MSDSTSFINDVDSGYYEQYHKYYYDTEHYCVDIYLYFTPPVFHDGPTTQRARDARVTAVYSHRA